MREGPRPGTQVLTQQKGGHTPARGFQQGQASSPATARGLGLQNEEEMSVVMTLLSLPRRGEGHFCPEAWRPPCHGLN